MNIKISIIIIIVIIIVIISIIVTIIYHIFFSKLITKTHQLFFVCSLQIKMHMSEISLYYTCMSCCFYFNLRLKLATKGLVCPLRICQSLFVFLNLERLNRNVVNRRRGFMGTDAGIIRHSIKYEESGYKHF